MKNALHLLACLQLFSWCVRADTVVVPNDRATQTGNTDSGVFAASSDFQLGYSSSNFSKPALITGIAFRLDEGTGGLSFDAVVPRVTIQMSTFTGRPFNPSFYGDNKGLDDATVYDGSVHWVTTDLPGGVPNPFDYRVHFSKAFTYDPSKGALLIHFTSSSAGAPGVDAQNYLDAAVGWQGFAGPFGQPGVTSFQTLVTEFEVTSVPEASFTWLMAVGMLALAFGRKRTATPRQRRSQC